MSEAVQVHTGFWTDWSHGAVHGATLTLTQRWGGVLTAFLAIFVPVVGGSFWNIIAFSVHQCNTTHPLRLRDALHYRRQVILRNRSAMSATWDFLKTWHESRSTAAQPALRLLPMILLATMILVVFYVSGIFTSYISSTPGNSTLVTGPSCGGYSFASDPSTSVAATELGKRFADTHQAASYVQECYLETSSGVDCGTFVRPFLPFSIQQNATCPFATGMCIYNDQSAVRMDSGLIDSFWDIGVNAPEQERIKYRRVMTCAPVFGEQFIEDGIDPYAGNTTYVYAGQQPGLSNYTFSHPQNLERDDVSYMLSVVDAYYGTLGNWIPDSRLNQTDADLTLFMLSQNSVSYMEPSDDLWMPAHIPINLVTLGVITYSADYEVNLMGCTEQYQFCNPNLPDEASCTDIASTSTVMDQLGELNLNPSQRLLADRTIVTSTYRDLPSVVWGHGAATLNVMSKVIVNVQQYSPPDQWQIEVSTWFATCLAKEQFWALEWATQPRNFPAPTPGEDPGWTYTPATTNTALAQCKNQLMRSNLSSGYQSFSVLGLGLILVFGVVIVLVALLVDTIAGCCCTRSRFGSSRYKREQWESEETMALHRAAYAGLGIWREGRYDGMPPSSALLYAAREPEDEEENNDNK